MTSTTAATGIGSGLSFIALGAILKFAVSASPRGFSIQTVGLILMIAGGIGLLIAVFELARSSSDEG